MPKFTRESENNYHDDFGIGRVVLNDGEVFYVGGENGGSGTQEGSVDGQGGTLRDKPVFTIDEAAYQLNRGAGPQLYEGVYYNSGANWGGAQGTANNEWYFLATSKTNGGEANDPSTQFRLTGATNVGPTGPLTHLNYGFYETQATLPDPYVFTRLSDGTNAQYIGDARAVGFSTFSAEQRAATREAIQSWDDLIKVTFVETPFQQGDINFMNTTTGPAQASAFLPYGSSTSSVIIQDDGTRVTTYERVGDVFVATPSVNASNGQLDEGQYGLNTLVHEIGHSLGLQHPGDYNFAPGFEVVYEGEDGAEYYQDSRMYSIMSYWDAEETGASHVNWEFLTYSYNSTPMVHDIAAIQRIYGADMTTRTGDTTYGFNASADTAGRDAYNFELTPTPVMSIWDAGGNDTLDLSGYDTPSLIDLNPGQFSSAGGFMSADIPTLDEINARRAAAGLAPRTQATYDLYMELFAEGYTDGLMRDNIGIAYGTWIENAVGGAGDDTIIANDVANVIRGGAGSDTVSYQRSDEGVIVKLDPVTSRGGSVVTWLLDLPDGFGGFAQGDKLYDIENVTGSNLNDLLTGNNVGNVLNGLGGNDTLLSLDGDDVLDGGDGNDNLFGGNDNDALNGGAGDDLLDGGNGEDTLNGGAGNDRLNGGNAKDVLNGGAGDDRLDGGNGKDTYAFTDAGTDTIVGYERGEKIDLSGLAGVDKNDVTISRGKIFVDLDGANDLTIFVQGDSVRASDLVFADAASVTSAGASAALSFEYVIAA